MKFAKPCASLRSRSRWSPGWLAVAPKRNRVGGLGRMSVDLMSSSRHFWRESVSPFFRMGWWCRCDSSNGNLIVALSGAFGVYDKSSVSSHLRHATPKPSIGCRAYNSFPVIRSRGGPSDNRRPPVLACSESQISSLADCATRCGSCFHASDASTYNSTWLPSGSAKYNDFVTS